MRLRLKQFLALSRLTARETMREPICMLLTASVAGLIAMLPSAIMFTLGEPQKLVRDSALSLQFVGGLLLAAVAACAAVQHEMKRGTVAMVLTKPVGRTIFFLSKFAGVAMVLVWFVVASGLATLLAARMVTQYYRVDWWCGAPFLAGIVVAMVGAGLVNYYTGRAFSSTAIWMLIVTLGLVLVGTSFVDEEGKWGAWGRSVTWKIVPAMALVMMALLVLAAIAVTLATRLDTVPTLSVCSVIFLAGLMSDYLFGRNAATHKLAAVVYGLLPNWQHFWMADALTGDGTIPWVYVGRAGVYAAFYLAGVLGLGILAFERMEVRSA